MRVFVAGATGVLGRRLVDRLADRGHEVVGLVRDDEGERLVRDRGGEPGRGDLLDPGSLGDPVADADVAIHAATAIPTDRKPSASDWERNDRVRLEGTRNLLDAAGEAGVDRVVLESVVWVARQPDGSRFDEGSPPNPDRTTESALAAERRLLAAADEGGFEPCVLRCGWFYAHDAAHTRQLGRGLLAGRFPIVGAGPLGRRDATLSYLHVDDAADAFVAATEGDATGRYHVVDDRPAPFADAVRAFADRLEVPTPRRIPGWLARFVVGRDAVRLLTNSMPTDNERFREAFDWAPSVPTYEDGAQRVVERWRESGAIEARDDGYEWVGPE